MRSEIQAYFRSVAEQYNIVPHVRFSTTVETSVWDEETQTWEVTIKDQKTKETTLRRCKFLVSAVGSLSVPKQCEIPGADNFRGPLFHSAQWDHSFDWKDKSVVVLGMLELNRLVVPRAHIWYRQWMQRNSIRSHNVFWPERYGKADTILPTSTLPLRTHQSDVLIRVQSTDALHAACNATVSVQALRRHGEGLCRLRH